MMISNRHKMDAILSQKHNGDVFPVSCHSSQNRHHRLHLGTCNIANTILNYHILFRSNIKKIPACYDS
uniref:Uncharacterized protein n=1 Tax=Arundo donax TaxID=35708 RepID=A0A0A9A0P3_ARUDO